MTRGIKVEYGTESVCNGYVYVKVADRNPPWVAKHRLIVEQALGRQLTDDEYVRFKDGKTDNLDPSNLEVFVKKQSKARSIGPLEKRIAKLRAELERLEDELAELQAVDS